MKRSFKLATVFTGVGAAAGAIGPMMLAGPANATAARPDIGTWKECGANNNGVSQWTHIYYPSDDHPAECISHGGTAVSRVGTATVASFCPGDQQGLIGGTISGVFSQWNFFKSQKREPIKFWTGDNAYLHMESIRFTDWSGVHKCT